MAHHCQQGRHRLYPGSLPREGEPVGGRELIAITVPARSSGFWGRGRDHLPGATPVTDRSSQAAFRHQRHEPRRPRSDTLRPAIPKHRTSTTQPISPASNLLSLCLFLVLGWNFFVVYSLHFVSARRMGGRGRLHGAVWRVIYTLGPLAIPILCLFVFYLSYRLDLTHNLSYVVLLADWAFFLVFWTRDYLSTRRI